MSKRRGRPLAIPEEKIEDFLSDYKSVGTIKGLAEKWGIAISTARRTLLNNGYASSGKRGGHNLKDCYHPKLGVWSDLKVAEDLGVSRQAVYMARKVRGVESPTARAMRIISGEEGS